MERFDELDPTLGRQCAYAILLRKNHVDAFEINAGHEVSGPAVHTVIARHLPGTLVSFRKVVLVSAGRDGAVYVGDVHPAQFTDLLPR
jgi:hypothetical protein